MHFATEIVTDVRTPGLCQLFADDGTVYVVAASFDFHNAAADIAHFVVGQKFVAAEAGITNTVRNWPLPLDDPSRNSAPATRVPARRRAHPALSLPSATSKRR